MFNSPFGGNTNTSSSPFGSTNTGFGGGGGQQNNMFGSTGGGGGLFGGGAGSTLGGNNSQSPFGQANRSTTFPASPTLQRGTGMGGTQGGMFGGVSTGFGSTAQSQPFGSALGQQSQPFGSTAQSQPFGSTAQSQPFGSAATQPFGSAASQPFGSTAQSQPFGSANNGLGGSQPFGGGATTNAFGSQPFGSAGGNSFGQPAGGFGQQQQMGTGQPPYAAPTVKENVNVNGRQMSVTNIVHAISAMPAYENKSFEELRLEDYRKRQGGGQQQPAVGAFGQQSTGATPFGGAAASPFGGAAAQPFGAAGATNSTSPFRAPAASTSAFGSSTSGFSFGAASSAPAFGAPQQTSAFGATTSASPFGGSAFGGNTAQPASNAFGAPSSTPAFGQAANKAASPFGGTSTNAFGSTAVPQFGTSSPGSTNAFGSTQQTNVFGGAAAPAFGSTTTAAPSFGGGFGTTTAAPAFGSTATAAPTFGGGFGTTAAAPAFGSAPTTSAFGGAGGFGSAATTATPAFGSAPTGGGGFGAGLSFGSAAGASAFGSAGKPATTPSFGGAAPTSAFGSNMFGSAQGAQAQPTTSAFGSFGGTSAFGQTQQPATNFGGGMFGGFSGNAAQQPQQAQQQQTGQAPLVTVSTSGNGFDVLDKKFDYLHRKKDTLEKSIYGGPGGSAGAGASGNSSANGSKGGNARASAGGSSPAVYSSGPMGGSGSGYRHTPLQQSTIYRSPSLRALSGPQGQQGSSSMVRSSSNQQLGDYSSQYMTPKGNRLLSSSGRLSATESASGGRSSGLLFSGSGNNLAVSASKHPKRLVIEPTTSVVEVSVDDMYRRAISQISSVETPSVHRDDRNARHTTDAAVVSDDEVSVEPAKPSPKHNEKYQTPSGKVLQSYNFKDQPNSANASSGPKNPPTMSADNGYVTSPDIKVLQDMDENELRHVYHFTVLHPKYGKIVWDGDSDLTGLDLDDIIKIEQNSVSVYEGDVEKPSVGTALNKPAFITLYNVKPPGSVDAAKFVSSMLKPACEKDDADFISYDEQSLEWTFKVYHFSRYGLVVEEDSQPAQATAAQKGETVNENSSGAINAAQVSGRDETKNGLMNFVLPEPNAAGGMDLVSPDVQFKNTFSAEKSVNLSATLGFDAGGLRRMRAAMQDSPSHSQGMEIEVHSPAELSTTPMYQKQFFRDPAVASEPVVQSPKNGGDPFSEALLSLSKESISSSSRDSAGESFCSAALKAAEREILPSTSSRQAASVRTGKRPDAALLHGKSFRAGFDCWGRMAFSCADDSSGKGKAGDNVVVNIVHLDVGFRGAEATVPSAFDEYASRTRAEKNDKCFTSCLESILDASRLSGGSENDESCVVFSSPQWLLPDAAHSRGLTEEYVRFVQLLHNLTGNFEHHFKEALSRGLSTLDKMNVTAEAMGHDPEWITLKCIEFLNALFGQEVSWLQRFKSGEENSLLTTMLPNDGEHESVLQSAEESRQLLLFGAGGNRSQIHFAKSNVERRRAALSKWLQDVCMNFGEALCGFSDSTTEGSPAHQIFDLLSAHRISDAVAIAEESGMYRLAMLLSQLGGDPDFAFLMRQQLESWFQSGAIEFIEGDLVDIYKLLGSDMSSSGGDASPHDGASPIHRDSVLSRVSWVRAIGLLFWYSCSCVEAAPLESVEGASDPFFLTTLTTLQVALDEYIRAVECGVAPEPRNPTNGVTDGACSSHAIFSLLLCCTAMVGGNGGDASVERLVADCTGFTADPLDHRGSYLILTLLKCLSMNENSFSEPCHAAIVRQHIISELLFSGQWHWATFVAMQIPNQAQRDTAVKDIIVRYAGGINWESLNDGHSSFVVEKLRVPDAWVHEATAYRLCCENTVDSSNSSLLLAAGGAGAFRNAMSAGGDGDDARAASTSGVDSGVSKSFFRRKNMEVAYLGLAGLWGSDRANRIISAITGPYALFSSAAASEKLLELLLQVEQFVMSTGLDITSYLWTQGSGALLVYLRFKERYSNVRAILADVSDAVELVHDDVSDSEFFQSARDELCGLYKDAYELLEVLKSRHSGIWKGNQAHMALNRCPNFSTVSHMYLCNELFQCLSMLHSVITSAQFRSVIDVKTFPDPLLLMCDSSTDNAAEDFPILTRSYVSSTASRLNSMLSERRGALSVDVVAFAF